MHRENRTAQLLVRPTNVPIVRTYAQHPLRNIFLCALLLLTSAAAAAPQPNIVFILVDDLGWQDVNCYFQQIQGKPSLYETPHIDRIASRGVRFMQAYAPAPTCAPSRAAYLTGQLGVKNGVWHVKGNRVPRPWDERSELNPYYSARLTPAQTIIPEVLKRAGYTTGHVGKWHVCGSNMVPTPLDMGFDFSYDKDNHYNDPDVFDRNDPKMTNKEGIFSQPRPTRLDAFDDTRLFPLLADERPYDSLTDISLRWLKKVGKQDQPFFLNFCPKLVHGPIMTHDRKRLAYYCKKLGIPFPKDPGAICDPEAAGFNNPYYAAMVDSVDWMVGQVIQTLEAMDDRRNPGHKLIDNTIVILTSDNGGAQKLATWKGLDGKQNFEKVTDMAPLTGGKTWMYEGGVRIPFIAMGPGIKPGTVNNASLISLLDMFPTFIAAAEIKPDALDLDGCNILHLLRGQRTDARFADGTIRDTLLFHHPMDNKSFSVIRQGDWKLIKNTGPVLTDAPELQLFRLVNPDGSFGDLGEHKNLLDAYPEVAKRLLGDLTAWMDQHDARVPYLNPGSKDSLPGQDEVPLVTKTGSDGPRLWAEFETAGKASIQKAFLIYSLNGGTELKYRPPRLEEWCKAPAHLTDGRVEADAPPGMTHGIFCLIDENNFLIYSDTVPPVGAKCRIDGPVSTFLQDGFAYRPGLISLIHLGEQANAKLAQKGVPTTDLIKALNVAKATSEKPVAEQSYAVAIRELRKAIRGFDGQVAESSLPDLNFLPLDRW